MTNWNERYNSKDFLFGKEPNRFFKEIIDKLSPGKLLLPADGEGRNAVSLIYCHVEPSLRTVFFDKLVESLVPGGVLFLEGFRKEQLGLPSGGPGSSERLYSAEQLASDFSRLLLLNITAETIWLDEGPGHQGEAKVVRLTGKR